MSAAGDPHGDHLRLPRLPRDGCDFPSGDRVRDPPAFVCGGLEESPAAGDATLGAQGQEEGTRLAAVCSRRPIHEQKVMMLTAGFHCCICCVGGGRPDAGTAGQEFVEVAVIFRKVPVVVILSLGYL